MLDTVYHVETPEGIELALRPAGPVARFWAWVIDALIRAALYAALGTLLVELGGRLGMGLMLIFLFLMEWFYPVLFEMLKQGQTPGKRVMGLRVVHSNGTPVTWNGSLIRNLLRAADFLPFAYGAALVTMLSRHDGKRLGDLAADTTVIHTEPRAKPPRLPEAQPLAPPWPLTLEQQRAVVDFAQRAPTLTPARARELANTLAPLLDARDETAVARLYRYAQWLAGRR